MKLKDITVFSLLHFNLDNLQSPNSVSNPLAASKIYVNCAVLLSKSLRKHSVRLNLFTNNVFFIRECNSKIDDYVNLHLLSSELTIPSGTKFYSAHQKIVAYRDASIIFQGETLMFLDLDCVVLNSGEFPDLSQVEAYGYDIYNSQIESYGRNSVYQTVKSISLLQHPKTYWLGGEFLLGNSAVFARIALECETLLPNYIKRQGELHHIGDEALVTAAFNRLNIDLKTQFTSSMSIISRLWSVKTNHRDSTCLTSLDKIVVHFPADKKFLSLFSRVYFSPAIFKLFYIPYYFFRKNLSRLKRRRIEEIL